MKPVRKEEIKLPVSSNEADFCSPEWLKAIEECSLLEMPRSRKEAVATLKKIHDTTDVTLYCKEGEMGIRIDMELPHYEDDSEWEADDMYAANEKNHFYAIDNAYRTALFYLNGITLAELSQIVIFELSTNVAEIDNNIDFLLRTMNNFAALQQANFRDLNSNELISLS